MEQLVYISTARSAAPTSSMVEDILRTSHRNNRRDGLTGMLVLGGRRFLQVLEGDPVRLELAYGRIKADKRHIALVQLSRKHVETRSFPDWEMAFHAGDSADEFEDLVTIVSRMTDTVDDPNLKALLRSFAELHAAAA